MSFHCLVCLQGSPKTFLNPVRILVLPPNHGGGVISKNTSERGQGEFCGSSMSSAIKVLSSAAIPVAHIPDD